MQWISGLRSRTRSRQAPSSISLSPLSADSKNRGAPHFGISPRPSSASIFPYVGITQIRYDRSKFDYFLSACSTSSLLYLSISLEDGICQAISISFKTPPAYSNILPSVEMVTTRQGINLPLICKAFFTACSIPPQQGTSIRTTVTLLMLLFAIISVSFSL